MIENLHGIQETVNFKENTRIRLYANEDYEHYPSHWHGPLEIILPLHNSYQVTCCDNDITLRVGDILIITPGVIHSMKPSVGKRLIFQADHALFHGIVELEATLTVISPLVLITPEDSPVIHRQIQRRMLEISDEYFSQNPLCEAAILSKLIDIFVLIGRNYSHNTNSSIHKNINKQCEYTSRFLYICDYINLHYNENITLDFAANMSGYSKYHFSRLFKQFTNVSFYKYLNKIKIENAEVLLKDNTLSVTEIALRCGFSSLSAFLRMFKLIKGCTPTEFKTMHNN